MAQLGSGEGLDGAEVGGLDVECVGVDGVIDSAGALERESEVEAWLGVVGGVAPGDNINRLVAMFYPPRPSANGTIPASNPPQRTVTFHYDDSGSGATTSEQINHLASRVSRLEDSVLGPRLAEFEYAGSMRRVSFNRGWNQALLAGVGAYAFG